MDLDSCGGPPARKLLYDYLGAGSMSMQSDQSVSPSRIEAHPQAPRVLSIFDDPNDPAVAESISSTLESNHIVGFPRCPFPLPNPADLQILRTELPTRLKLKNVSYHGADGRLTGLEANDPARARTAAVLGEHLEAVCAYLRQVAPHLSAGTVLTKCSFRPIQERGRKLKPHASNELVHVDAGAYGATHGDRILRFFVNVNPSEDRVWATKGDIQEVLERHGVRSGLLDNDGRCRLRIRKNPADHAFTLTVRALSRLNPQAQSLDSSPYDRAMRRLHNYMKDSETFKADPRGYAEIRFPPGSAWMVFTDGVSHASLSGQFALVTTILIRHTALRHPQFAPYHLLSGGIKSCGTGSPG